MRYQWLLPILISGLLAACGGTPHASTSPSPDVGGVPGVGDIPDNAVFLTYTDPTLGFSIQYVEGWQVAGRADGVVISDKDSSEIVMLTALPGDLAGFVTSSDLPSLQAQSGFRLVLRDSVSIGQSTYIHLSYELPSPPDPVTGKRVPSSVDRYYVPGASKLAIISLSTPPGVDNVDAFRQMISSFGWP